MVRPLCAGQGDGTRAGAAPEPDHSSCRDPRLADKLRDVVGLYFDPPAHALVLSDYEKNQIQTLDRTQPDFLLRKGSSETMTRAVEEPLSAPNKVVVP